MNLFRPVFQTLFLVAITLSITSLAQAQATRTWVSGVGDDSNPCSRTAPCLTLAAAISKTATGGEINVIDMGAFGSVRITKSITINVKGAFAGIIDGDWTHGKQTPRLGAGIIIEITDPADIAKTVRLRGLSLNGAGSAVHGIRVIAANKVSIEDSVIDGFSTNGINVEATSSTQVFVKNSTISNNSGSGIKVMSDRSQVVISDVTVIFNGTGLDAVGGAIISLKNNTIYGNKKDGDATSSLVPR